MKILSCTKGSVSEPRGPLAFHLCAKSNVFALHTIQRYSVDLVVLARSSMLPRPVMDGRRQGDQYNEEDPQSAQSNPRIELRLMDSRRDP